MFRKPNVVRHFSVLVFSLLLALGQVRPSAASDAKIDSLKAIVASEEMPDSTRVDALRRLAIGFKKIDIDSANAFALRSYELAKRSKDKKRMSAALWFLGSLNWSSNQTAALRYFQECKELYNELGRKDLVANCLMFIGSIYRDQGNYGETIEYFTQNLAIRKELKDSSAIAVATNNLGVVYLDQFFYDEATDWFEQSLDISKRIGDKGSMSKALLNLGLIHERKNDNTQALQLYNQSLALKNEVKDIRGVATLLVNMSIIHREQNRLKLAEECLFRSLHISDSISFYQCKVAALTQLGKTKRARKDLAASIRYNTQALELAQTNGILAGVKNASEALYITYSDLNKHEKALEMHELFIQTRDSLRSEENQRSLIKQGLEFQFEKEALTDSLEYAKKEAVMKETSKNQQLGLIAAAMGLLLLLALAGAIFIGKKRSDKLLQTVSSQHEELKEAKVRGDKLLLNILPENVANELMEKNEVKAQKHEMITVLFTDFEGFTELASNTDAEQLVDEINTCFSAFDYMTSKYGVEKIKTIGDAYMAASGLDGNATEAAKQVVSFGLRIQRFMKKHNANRQSMGLNPLPMRVGIHTGPVVAGVVGIKKFQYDIWGDTVNIASRMEASGDADTVNISEATYKLVKDHFNCTHRGKIKAKGKGEMEMYFVSPNLKEV